MKQPAILKAKQSSRSMALGLIAIFIALFNFNDLFAETRTASVSGNWNNTTTWGGAAVPLSSDDVIINTGVTVIMDVDATCLSVTTGTASGTAAIDGNKTLTTGVLKITNGGGVNQSEIIFSIGSGTTLVCSSIAQLKENGTVSLIVNGTLRNSGTTSALDAFTCNTGSTVEYNGEAQSIFDTTYSNLTLSGSGIKTLVYNLTVKGILTINTNVSIDTKGRPLTLEGDFITYGTFDAGVSNILLNGTAEQNIAGFTTTGTVSMIKTAGTATLKDNVNGGLLTISGSGGSLNLGDDLTHTFTGNWTMSSGTLYCSSSTLKIGGGISGTGATFIAGTGTVEYNGTSQKVFSTNYKNLILSGNGAKSLQTGTTSITGNFSLYGTASTATVAGLTIDGNLVIGNGTTFTVAGFPLTIIGTTTVGGILNFSSSIGNKLFSGLVTISTGGNWNNVSENSPVSFAGGITKKGIFQSGAGIHSFITNAQPISGALSFSKISILGIKVTNNNSLTVDNELAGTGDLTQAPNAALNIGGTSTITTLNAETPGNTVNYAGVGQTIKATTYYNLTTSGTVTKTIPANSAVTVGGNLSTGGLLTINSDASNSGSLIVKGTSSGNVTYNRWFNSAANPANFSRWYITSAPLNISSGFDGAKYNGTTTNTSKIHKDGSLFDFAPYSESGNNWSYVLTIPSILSQGEGYLISLRPATDGMIQFKGTLNGDFTKSITSSSTNNGWNCIGNPYTSAIKIIGTGGFIEANTANLNPSYAAIYVWNETASYDETQQYYRVISNAGYDSHATGISLLQNVNNIQVGQGFIVKAKTGGGNVSFTKAMQIHDTGLSLKSSKLSWPGITLVAESHGQTCSTVLAFNDQMTTGLDVTYDAGLLSSNNFKLFTHLVDGNNPVDFAIQCLPEDQYNQLSVPVGVDLSEGGDLVFKASGNLLPNGLYPIIEDKELNIKTALKTETDNYTVHLAKNTAGIGRFYLSFSNSASRNMEVPINNRFTATCLNNHIVLYGVVDTGTKALLYDISGRKVGEYPLKNLNRNEITVSSLSQRVYLLKIEGRNYSKVIKLVAVNTNY